MAQLWKGRFKKELAKETNDFNSSIKFDSRMFEEDIKGSIAHATMLGATGIIDKSESDKIVDGLNGILDDIRAEFLHLTEMIYNPLLRRSGSKVMEGTDNMHPCFMRRVSYRLHGIFASGQFHVN